MSLTLNDFVERSRPGKMIRRNGFTTHAQAGARTDGWEVLFLLLQGRQTHVRAHWASFHEKDLPYYNRLPGKEAYLKPNPTATLPSGNGMELAIVDSRLVPGQFPAGSNCFFTFGPPHFGVMFQAAMAVPMLPHWERALFQLGLEQGLIAPVQDTWNVNLWWVSAGSKRWLAAMSAYHDRFPYELEVTP
jgi:hypothetical protein